MPTVDSELYKDILLKEGGNERLILEELFDHCPVLIVFFKGESLTIEYFNHQYRLLFPDRELIGRFLEDAIPEVKGTDTLEQLKKVYTSGKTSIGHEIMIPFLTAGQKFPKEHYFNYTRRARYNASGEIDGVLSFGYDVTDSVVARKNLELREKELQLVNAQLWQNNKDLLLKTEIEQSEKKLVSLLNALPQMAWTKTAEGIVTYFNQRWYTYTGLSHVELSTVGIFNLIHDEDKQVAVANFKKMVAAKRGGEFENRYKSADGSYRWHLNRMEPILTKEGEIQYWIGTATDIQALKDLQQQKDDFVSIASHELKTPLTSLNLSIQLINEIKEDPSPLVLISLVNRATRNLNKLMLLVDDLLNVSKLNQGQLHLNKTWFTVSELVRECCSHILTGGMNCIEIEGDLDVKVYADADRIEQVILNFVNNAIKYAPLTKIIKLNIEITRSGVRVSVIDKGPGIATEKLEHLFDRYYRVDQSGSQYSGLGLGLYICAEIIERHKGLINVESTLGSGSTFWFSLPVYS